MTRARGAGRDRAAGRGAGGRGAGAWTDGRTGALKTTGLGGGGAGLNQLGAAGGAQFIRIPRPLR